MTTDVPQGTLTMTVEVVEWFIDERDRTTIRIDFGNSCYMSFVVHARLAVPKFLTFIAKVPVDDR